MLGDCRYAVSIKLRLGAWDEEGSVFLNSFYWVRCLGSRLNGAGVSASEEAEKKKLLVSMIVSGLIHLPN
jgi:hypothetical protein